jgi:alcohol dehydrogenase YqhD (iron-dependent ADH family)
MEYEISEKKIVDIYNNVYETRSVNVACMAYMDDTNIISNNKEKVKKIFEHINEFNNLNDIQINKEKSEILLRKNDKKDEKKIILKFGDKTIIITPIKKNQSLRILDVWFNAYTVKP